MDNDVIEIGYKKNNLEANRDLKTVKEVAALLDTTDKNVYQSVHQGYECCGVELRHAVVKKGRRIYFDIGLIKGLENKSLSYVEVEDKDDVTNQKFDNSLASLSYVEVEDKDDVTNQKFDNSLASLIYHDSYSGEEIDLLDFKWAEEKVVTDNDVDLENVTIVIADSITKFVENSQVDTYITNLRSQNVEKIYVYKLNEIINKITNNNDNRSNKRSIADWFKEVFHQIFG